MAKIATPQAKNVVRKATEVRPRSTNAKTEIEKLAYQFYVERGFQDGFHEQDWLRAEAIVLSRSRS